MLQSYGCCLRQLVLTWVPGMCELLLVWWVQVLALLPFWACAAGCDLHLQIFAEIIGGQLQAARRLLVAPEPQAEQRPS